MDEESVLEALDAARAYSGVPLDVLAAPGESVPEHPMLGVVDEGFEQVEQRALLREVIARTAGGRARDPAAAVRRQQDPDRDRRDRRRLADAGVAAGGPRPQTAAGEPRRPGTDGRAAPPPQLTAARQAGRLAVERGAGRRGEQQVEHDERGEQDRAAVAGPVGLEGEAVGHRDGQQLQHHDRGAGGRPQSQQPARPEGQQRRRRGPRGPRRTARDRGRWRCRRSSWRPGHRPRPSSATASRQTSTLAAASGRGTGSCWPLASPSPYPHCPFRPSVSAACATCLRRLVRGQAVPCATCVSWRW